MPTGSETACERTSQHIQAHRQLARPVQYRRVSELEDACASHTNGHAVLGIAHLCVLHQSVTSTGKPCQGQQLQQIAPGHFVASRQGHLMIEPSHSLLNNRDRRAENSFQRFLDFAGRLCWRKSLGMFILESGKLLMGILQAI